MARAGCAVAALLVSSTAALAETPGAAEHQGLPQLDTSLFPPQLVWLAICFIVLYRLMTKRALPLVAEVLEQRRSRIGADLDKATTARDESQAIVAHYEQALAAARSDAQTVIGTAVTATAATNAQRLATVVDEINAKTKGAESTIRAAHDQAVTEIRSVAVGIARDATARLAGLDIDDATADQAVAVALQEHGR
ncbi:MAG: hypothetical protein P4M00_09350 [Azospirillaceae bacterium]|nr:hypothetical protein [Azospirillaceae bacterium]